MVKQDTVDGWMLKKEVLYEPGRISDDFELHELEFYKLVTTITRDDQNKKFILYPLNDEIN